MLKESLEKRRENTRMWTHTFSYKLYILLFESRLIHGTSFPDYESKEINIHTYKQTKTIELQQ